VRRESAAAIGAASRRRASGSLALQCAQHSVFYSDPNADWSSSAVRIPVFDLKMPYTLWADTSARRAMASTVIPA